MTDDLETEKNSLNNSPITEVEDIGDITIPTKETETNNPNQKIDNMEVHHHSSHDHGKKTWRTYGWEFGMLFLAVFCGFLAEYFLEHRIEKEKGTQYVLSMIEDLESDSAKINEDLVNLKKQVVGLDSLSLLCSNSPYNDSTIKHMYQLMYYNTASSYQIGFTKRTITQLKNSGGMRLISNKASADAITEYAELIEDVESQGEYYDEQGIGEIVNLSRKIFNFNYMRGYNLKNKSSFFLKSKVVKLVNDDEKLMAEYSNQNFITSRVVAFYIYKLNNLQEQIPKTIAILKKENHLE
ncbi:hypothetical protein [Flavobacterium granuli]|uniref:Uncharacterized protein n=1 Tax=Flavobacterium granuli TaxID=280093 RepID=A0ABU1S5K7_9FLAO|nr:hypothetical protein [Flavobacterium granuli]MDR6846301.1 hypothetical protein [Flavobacterium granuli]